MNNIYKKRKFKVTLKAFVYLSGDMPVSKEDWFHPRREIELLHMKPLKYS